MTRFLLTALAGTLAFAGAAEAKSAASAAHPAFKGAKYAAQARLTLDKARVVALKAHPGQVTDEELEREGGGSGLRYSFDVKSNGKTAEVGVDAKTGRVLENKLEGPNPD